MKKFVLFGMLFLTLATSLDAAPRRRRARRARRVAVARPAQCVTCVDNAVAPLSTSAAANAPMASVAKASPTTQSPPASPPIVLASGPTDVPLVVGEQPTVAAEATADAGDPLPTVDVVANVQLEDQPSPSDVAPAAPLTAADVPATAPAAPTTPGATTADAPVAVAEPVNPALMELNEIRRRRGLFPLLEDRGLTLIARRKASIQASRGYMGHPGGTMGGARFEGVGMGSQFTTCYQHATNARYAGAATVVGRNGRRYHCLLLR